eukprot:CAMPEP_0114344224 /NCGR_PEP_ID=MMETSP0101-20121206/11253_1 /TAXON_ID=38822 ORGANISM="Pteridomonas danica, Strain PT" /NCGR_SAMPLE_ID=MMETSP0101 /ASSEMBLY_ACC=CAM_ASM_000211 /LENGTH=367 /DNA_ID=CAMNT_0001479453 /DNA_START=2393 /DNA_END=3497 /DNA_ORIENTATION=+
MEEQEEEYEDEDADYHEEEKEEEEEENEEDYEEDNEDMLRRQFEKYEMRDDEHNNDDNNDDGGGGQHDFDYPLEEDALERARHLHTSQGNQHEEQEEHYHDDDEEDDDQFHHGNGNEYDDYDDHDDHGSQGPYEDDEDDYGEEEGEGHWSEEEFIGEVADKAPLSSGSNVTTTNISGALFGTTFGALSMIQRGIEGSAGTVYGSFDSMTRSSYQQQDKDREQYQKSDHRSLPSRLNRRSNSHPEREMNENHQKSSPLRDDRIRGGSNTRMKTRPASVRRASSDRSINLNRNSSPTSDRISSKSYSSPKTTPLKSRASFSSFGGGGGGGSGFTSPFLNSNQQDDLIEYYLHVTCVRENEQLQLFPSQE